MYIIIFFGKNNYIDIIQMAIANIVSFGVCVFGMIFIILVSNAQKKLSTKCVDTTVQNGLNFMLVLSVMMTVLPVVQLGCLAGCDGCTGEKIPYKALLLALLFTMGVTAAIVYSKLKGACDTKSVGYFTLATAIICLLAVCLYIALAAYGLYQEYGESSSSQGSGESSSSKGSSSSVKSSSSQGSVKSSSSQGSGDIELTSL